MNTPAQRPQPWPAAFPEEQGDRTAPAATEFGVSASKGPMSSAILPCLCFVPAAGLCRRLLRDWDAPSQRSLGEMLARGHMSETKPRELWVPKARLGSISSTQRAIWI